MGRQGQSLIPAAPLAGLLVERIEEALFVLITLGLLFDLAQLGV